MFVLTRIDSGENHCLLNNKEYVVGRKNCDILIADDPSISRKHAILRVKGSYVTLEDCGSKYHTQHNSEQMQPSVEVKLHNNGLIQFGVGDSKYSFKHFKFITTATGLNASQKTSLKKDLNICNGKYVEKWTSDCTHLTVEKITLTIKLLQALIDEKPIVIPQYWSDYARSVAQKLPLPDIEKYNQPPLAETLLNKFDFNPNPQRKKLFENKVFVFLKEKSKNQMEDVIKSCGGECISWEHTPMIGYDIKLSPKEFLIIKVDGEEENPSLNAIIMDFNKEGKRTIPLPEIALAVVLCSCEINCNPNFDKAAQVFKMKTQQEPSQGNVLAPDTQSQLLSGTVVPKKEVIIQETVETDLDSFQPVKTKRLPTDQGNENNTKKIKVEVTDKRTITAAQDKTFIGKQTLSQKRKAEDAVDETKPKKTLKENPFAFVKPSTSKQTSSNTSSNPFQKFKTPVESSSKNTSVSSKNPFNSIKRKNETSISNTQNNPFNDQKRNEPLEKPKKKQMFHSTLIEGKDTCSLDFSKDSKIHSLISVWRSKGDVSIKTIKEEDSEFDKVAELFKNCVQVNILPQDYIRKHVNVVTFDTSNGKKNYKRFKKVLPLKPQTTIISSGNFIKVGPGNTTGIHALDMIPDIDEDMEKPISRNARKPKMFVL